METEFGTLFSHASQASADDLVAGGHTTRAAAKAHGRRVCVAQPGIESEPMTREPAGVWRSRTGLTARDVINLRWA